MRSGNRKHDKTSERRSEMNNENKSNTENKRIDIEMKKMNKITQIMGHRSPQPYPRDQEKGNERGAGEEGKDTRRLGEAGRKREKRRREEGREREERRSIIKGRTHVVNSFICVHERSLSGDTWSPKEIARESKPQPAFASPLDDARLSYSPVNAIRTILSLGGGGMRGP